MPLLWRYLLKNFLKMFCLCIFSFLSILIVLKAQQIAKFASTQEGLMLTLLFTALQLPYFLPFAIPLSTLLSGFVVSKQLCDSTTLTSLRSFGLSFKDIFFPLYALALFLSLLNFLLISEICPFSKRKTKELLNHSIKQRPLSLLEDENFLRAKRCCVYRSSLEPAAPLFIASVDKSHNKLTLIQVGALSCENASVIAKNTHIFSSSTQGNPHQTLIESYEFLKTPLDAILTQYKKPHLTHTFEELSTKKCLIKLQNADLKHRSKGLFELAKRMFFFCIPFSFATLGLTSAVRIGRQSKPAFATLILFTLALLASYFLGKSFEKHFYIAMSCFFLPQVALVCHAYIYLRQIRQGKHA